MWRYYKPYFITMRVCECVSCCNSVHCLRCVWCTWHSGCWPQIIHVANSSIEPVLFFFNACHLMTICCFHAWLYYFQFWHSVVPTRHSLCVPLDCVPLVGMWQWNKILYVLTLQSIHWWLPCYKVEVCSGHQWPLWHKAHGLHRPKWPSWLKIRGLHWTAVTIMAQDLQWTSVTIMAQGLQWTPVTAKTVVQFCCINIYVNTVT
jgi:hypothetical protein